MTHWYGKVAVLAIYRSRKGAILQVKERWVVNLSKHSLKEEEKRVLEKGLSFAPTPRHVPVMDVLASVENALRSCRDVRAVEVARGKVTGII